MPEVSIVTPVYNSEDFLEDMLGSVLRQTFSDWELLVVDDCSKDDSLEIVKKYVRRDSRIKLIQLERNSGAAVARNSAIQAARGRFIAFLDSDDMWLPNKLELHLEFIKSRKAALSYTGYEKITEQGERTGSFVFSEKKLTYCDLLKSNKIGCLTVVYDTSVLGKVYMPLIRKRQDYALWLDILKKVPCAEGLDKPLSLYRQRSGSISSNKLEMIRYHWFLFREIENMSFAKSAYYLAWNIWGKLIRR